MQLDNPLHLDLVDDLKMFEEREDHRMRFRIWESEKKVSTNNVEAGEGVITSIAAILEYDTH